MATLEKKPIFIVSCPRSGSTLMRLILNAHPRICVPPPGFLYDYFRPYLYSYGNLASRDNLLNLAQDMLDTPPIRRWDRPPTAEQLVAEAAENSFRGLFDALYRCYAAREGKARWGEKSPRHGIWIDEIHEDFPGAQFVHIIRDGRDTAIDISDAEFPPESLFACAAAWSGFVQVTREAGRRLPAGCYHEIRYEELCADPAAELARLCEFLGEEFSPALLQHHATSAAEQWSRAEVFHAKVARPITTEFCGIHRNLSRDDRDAIEALIGSTLVEFGYPCDGGARPLPERLARKLLMFDTITSHANAPFKIDLRERRKKRLKQGIWSESERSSQLWSVV